MNVTRATALAGIPVIVASADAESPVFASRYCDALLLPPLEPPGAAVEKLAHLGERISAALGRRVPLFYGDDDYLNLILQNRARLARYYRFLLNEPEVAASLIDKDRFDAFARSRDLPVPRTLEWEELEACIGPVLAKPKLKVDFDHSTFFLRLLGRAGKARLFANAQQLIAHPLARALRDELVFQEYIPGDDHQIWSFHGYADEESRVLASFIGRKIRTYPPLIGVSTFLELDHHDQLAALGQRVVARAPLKGVFKIDFKQDPASGRFVVLEVNARFNLWHYLGAASGVNIPRVAYDYLVHGMRPAAAPRIRWRYRWLNFGKDWLAYRDLAARGELGLWRWAASIAATRKVYNLFAWSDPLPLVHHWLRRLRRLPRVTARLTRWLFTAS